MDPEHRRAPADRGEPGPGCARDADRRQRRAEPGQHRNVAITLTKTAAGCGFKIKYGDGAVEGPFGFTGASKLKNHVYTQPGSYTIEVWGKKKGNNPKCKGGTQTAQLTVSGGGGSGSHTLQKAPGGVEVLKPRVT